MSQPKGERRASKVEYVYEARGIREHIVAMTKKLPKSWQSSRSRHLLDLAWRLSDGCQTANDVYVTCEAERAIRLQNLWAAHGACRCLQDELSVVYSRKPTKAVYRTEDGHVLRGEDGTPVLLRTKQCVGDAELEKLQERITAEANLIKGVIDYERSRA